MNKVLQEHQEETKGREVEQGGVDFVIFPIPDLSINID